MRTWQLPVNKQRQQATHAPSETDENIRHVVSPASRPGVFQIALFKGFPDIPHIPLPPEHSVGKNEATRSPTRENPQSWKEQGRPREIFKLNSPIRHHIQIKYPPSITQLKTNGLPQFPLEIECPPPISLFKSNAPSPSIFKLNSHPPFPYQN